jgi:hypothetical protein
VAVDEDRGKQINQTHHNKPKARNDGKYTDEQRAAAGKCWFFQPTKRRQVGKVVTLTAMNVQKDVVEVPEEVGRQRSWDADM